MFNSLYIEKLVEENNIRRSKKKVKFKMLDLVFIILIIIVNVGFDCFN